MMAEAAGFLLAQHMPRPEALKIVTAALHAMQADPVLTLSGALTALAPGHDWPALLAPSANLGQAPDIARAPQDGA